MNFHLPTILTIISYILFGVGVFYGIQEINKNNLEQGMHNFIQIGVLPLLFIAFLRHTVLGGKGNIIKTHPFFEYEAGGANLGIFIGLLVALNIGLSVKALSCLLIIFLVYLIVAALTSVKFIGGHVLLKFVPVIGVLGYFIEKGLTPVHKHTSS